MKYFLGKRFLLVWLCATAIALSTCSYIPPTNLKAPGLSLSDLALKEFSSERVKLRPAQ